MFRKGLGFLSWIETLDPEGCGKPVGSAGLDRGVPCGLVPPSQSALAWPCSALGLGHLAGLCFTGLDCCCLALRSLWGCAIDFAPAGRGVCLYLFLLPQGPSALLPSPSDGQTCPAGSVLAAPVEDFSNRDLCGCLLPCHPCPYAAAQQAPDLLFSTPSSQLWAAQFCLPLPWGGLSPGALQAQAPSPSRFQLTLRGSFLPCCTGLEDSLL